MLICFTFMERDEHLYGLFARFWVVTTLMQCWPSFVVCNLSENENKCLGVPKPQIIVEYCFVVQIIVNHDQIIIAR